METIIVGSSQRDIVELDNEFYHSNHQNISLIDKIFPKQLSKQKNVTLLKTSLHHLLLHWRCSPLDPLNMVELHIKLTILK